MNGDDVHIILLPGPPRELNQMYYDSVEPILKKVIRQNGRTFIECKNLFFSGLGESELASRINRIVDCAEQRVECGYCIKPGGIIFRCLGEASVVLDIETRVKKSLQDYYLGDGINTLQEFIVKLSLIHISEPTRPY